VKQTALRTERDQPKQLQLSVTGPW
jgi:hypothetical protein